MQAITRRQFLGLISAGAVAAMVPDMLQGTMTGAKRSPNIVFFLIEDMGWMDSEAYGNTYYESPA
ncbi:MAG: twin-arginine translocation signal domain-containing protein [Planctomycetota bacterium]|jgi:hypothetical protein